MKKLFQFILLIFFIGCSSNEENQAELPEVEIFITRPLKEYIQAELLMKSSDVSSCCCVSISESLFPNNEKHQLDSPKEYFNVEKSGFYVSREYFFSKGDSIVRAILYQWEWPKYKMSTIEKLFPENSKSEKLYEKYNLIAEEIKKSLGEPTSNEIVEEGFYRESYFWNQKEGSKAYLFVLGNKKKNFYRLRLVRYE